MSWTDSRRAGGSSAKDLRRFGLGFGSGLGLLGALLLWRGRPAWPWVLGGAGAVLLVAIVLPRALAPLEWLLAKTFRAVTTALTYVLVTLTFYLMITPIGLLMRLLGRDPLGLRFDPERQSYWVDAPPDGPSSRPDKPF